jgi:hypothetical protein
MGCIGAELFLVLRQIRKAHNIIKVGDKSVYKNDLEREDGILQAADV